MFDRDPSTHELIANPYLNHSSLSREILRFFSIIICFFLFFFLIYTFMEHAHHIFISSRCFRVFFTHNFRGETTFQTANCAKKTFISVRPLIRQPTKFPFWRENIKPKNYQRTNTTEHFFFFFFS